MTAKSINLLSIQSHCLILVKTNALLKRSYDFSLQILVSWKTWAQFETLLRSLQKLEMGKGEVISIILLKRNVWEAVLFALNLTYCCHGEKSIDIKEILWFFFADLDILVCFSSGDSSKSLCLISFLCRRNVWDIKEISLGIFLPMWL